MRGYPEPFVSETVDWDDDDDEVIGTGTYVVLGIFEDEGSFDISVAYGPFNDIEDASKYGTTNFQWSWVCEIVNTETSSNAPVIHPNQSTISDYIDPSVVE